MTPEDSKATIPRSKGDELLIKVGPWVLAAAPAFGFLMTWLIGTLVQWDGQGGILALPFVLLAWCGPLVFLVGLVGFIWRRNLKYFAITLIGLLECALFVPVFALAGQG